MPWHRPTLIGILEQTLPCSRATPYLLAAGAPFRQIAVFQTLGLAPIRSSLGFLSDPLDTRRVVLLVPKSGLLLLRAFRQAELYLALSGKVQSFDNHFVGVHTAFVRVRRGNRDEQDGHDGWRSLSNHLMVRDTREDDPEAELMASAMVPTFALLMAPPALTELQLRPRDSFEIFQAPKDIVKKMGGVWRKRFFAADLADADKTAILTPGKTGDFHAGGVARRRLACPEEAVTVRPRNASSRPHAARQGGTSSSRAGVMHRFMHGRAAVDQAINLITQQAGDGNSSSRLLYRVSLTMASPEAQQRMAEGGAPVVEKTSGPCAVRVKIGDGLSHVTSFPFPVRRGSVNLKYSKSQGLVRFTVAPLAAGESRLPFAWSCDVQGGARAVLPSMPAWSPCPPLGSLPRLDFKAEWAHDKVRVRMRKNNEVCPSTQRRTTILAQVD